MDVRHRMHIEADNGDEVLFECRESGCGRRLVLKRSGGLVVLDRGDVGASHHGASDGLQITVGLRS
jgi:hypothetical protein